MAESYPQRWWGAALSNAAAAQRELSALFLSPFPPDLISPAFPPSQDPPGFDRAALHPLLNAEILTFLRRVL
jgi:hypothetical protein